MTEPKEVRYGKRKELQFTWIIQNWQNKLLTVFGVYVALTIAKLRPKYTMGEGGGGEGAK